ncbi:TraR/DksA C4-type zinc finger protein [Paraferrimonas haliotis]|uniref:Zinc finger DksA/TraR C4-type domain-containing protein n=1 Tax=Paraferrimonas haliotis TaxID=2013866 RepID=A0AA37TVX6_9GAMM|nr:TraR/DksA C4-type zinc finger protein [Paraferrimonas haliotis]GLS83882.1 hypothetical protein GCM10007894_18590 [Paraferrimonas haliotis]GLS84009.1 hypothetical protein GCM10007894_19860 [Paraferrimonas haliotis]
MKVEIAHQLLRQHSEQVIAQLVDSLSAQQIAAIRALKPDEQFTAISAYRQALSPEQIKRVVDLEAAWFQYQQGVFTLCADCEEPIEDELLMANPTAQRCAHCHAHYLQQRSPALPLCEL